MAILNNIETIHNRDGTTEINLSIIYLQGEHRRNINELLGEHIAIVRQEGIGSFNYDPYSDMVRTYRTNDGRTNLIHPSRQSLYNFEKEPKHIEMEKVD